MRNALFLSAICLAPIGTWACPRCAPLVQSSVFNANFLANLLLIVLPVVLTGLIAAVLHRWGDRS